MRTTFLSDDFLLTNDVAQELFHNHAKHLPVIDYHNHLDPAGIATNRKFRNIGELWVSSDPYKHRAMRMNGIPEQEVSGNASDKEKYNAWAHTYPKTVGNPLYHWSALELKRIFDIDELLTPQNTNHIWEQCNLLLQQPEYSTVGLLKKWNTEIICTSDDLLDDIQIHHQASLQTGTLSVLPSLRADSIIALSSPSFPKWLESLKKTHPIKSLEDYQQAIRFRLDAFAHAGCRVSDHALDNGFYFSLPSEHEAKQLFGKHLLSGNLLSEELLKTQSYLLYWLVKEYATRNWVMQLHIGAERFTSSRLRRLAGTAGGYATIGNTCDIQSLCRLLDGVESEGLLPKTILYPLNPADYASLATLVGSFTADHIWGKLQLGPAWWYNDHKEGIANHLRTVSNFSLLSRFVGMTTDSRSLLSFSRHEYFRRILCNYLGKLAEAKEIPADIDFMSQLVHDISYENAKEWIFNSKL